MFGEAGHGTLEGMAVQVGQARDRHARDAIGGRVAGSGLDARDDAMVDVDDDVAPPAVRGERRFEVQFTRHAMACTVSASTC